jgi:hypothetical protein
MKNVQNHQRKGRGKRNKRCMAEAWQARGRRNPRRPKGWGRGAASPAAGSHLVPVQLEAEPVQLAEVGQVLAHQVLQLLPLALALLLVPEGGRRRRRRGGR